MATRDTTVDPGDVRPDEAPPGTPKRRLAQFSLILRRTHMFAALFLTPWLTMYALSTVVFNHYSFFEEWYGGSLDRYEKESEVAFAHTFTPEADDATIARQIRKDLNLPGNLVLWEEDDDRYVFRQNDDHRFTPIRITYVPSQKKLVLEKQKMVLPNFLTRLHARVGRGDGSPARLAWAVSVDLSILASVIWILSGLWMWWELKVTRRWGLFFVIAGPALFGLIWYFG